MTTKWTSPEESTRSNLDANSYELMRKNRNSGVAVQVQYNPDGTPKSNYQSYLENQNAKADAFPHLSGKAMSQLSDERRQAIHAQASQQANSGPRPNLTSAGVVKKESVIKQAAKYDLTKTAGFATNAGSMSINGPGNSTHLAPELYSPLFLTQNLQLPRDRITANAWNRAYYETNPIVRNCINLHATYPISKLNLKCEDKKREQFFLDMAEEIDLTTLVQQASLEWWKIGEFFAYANFNEGTGKWDKVYLHNPDYISVKASVIPGLSTISLKPDSELEKIVTSNDPAYERVRQQIDQRVINHVLQGEYIPLDNFNISHVKHLTSAYDIRGTSIIVSCWKDLMLYDKLRECFDVSTELLTENGFEKWTDVIELPNLPGDEPKLKKKVKIACFNPKTEQIEYHYPIDAVARKYTGKMVHFVGDKVNTMVTPGHRMNVSKKTKAGWSAWHPLEAKNITKGNFYKFRSKAEWVGVEKLDFKLASKTVPADLFLEWLGYVISEGCVYHDPKHYDSKIILSQLTSKPDFQAMRDVSIKMAAIFDRKLSESIKVKGSGFSKNHKKEMWNSVICHKDLVSEMKKLVGTDGKTDSFNKRIPRKVFGLSKRQLNILLKALVAGDGNITNFRDSISFTYTTVSKGLADDVYELVYKCGHVPSIYTYRREGKDTDEYYVHWSTTANGDFPMIYGNENHWGANIKEVDYDDYVWCVTVPTDMFITRREGKITVQHNCKYAQADGMINPLTLIKIGASNSEGHYPRAEEIEYWRDVFEQAQFDKDFKIISHPDISIERVGFSGALVDVQNDFNMIIDNVMMGLMVPKSVISQEGSSYASASVGLDVMRQRYNNFRTMMANWLIKKIFAPIAELNHFYEYKNGEKKLILPEIEWNQMTLYDLDTYIGHLVGLYDKQPRVVSKKTLFRSLGLNVLDEEANVREESIRETIVLKEVDELAKKTLSELRSLDPTTPLVESNDEGSALLPGVPSPDAGSLGGLPDMSGGSITPPGAEGLGGPPAMPDLPIG